MRTTDDAWEKKVVTAVDSWVTRPFRASRRTVYFSIQATEIRAKGRTAMRDRISLAPIAVAAATWATKGAWSQESAKFPDWKGQWVRTGAGGQYDPSKPAGRGQQPPLTPEYQAIWEANIAEGRSGGQYYNPQVR